MPYAKMQLEITLELLRYEEPSSSRYASLAPSKKRLETLRYAKEMSHNFLRTPMKDEYITLEDENGTQQTFCVNRVSWLANGTPKLTLNPLTVTIYPNRTADHQARWGKLKALMESVGFQTQNAPARAAR